MQLLALSGIMLASAFVFSLVAMLVLRPFFGIDISREGAFEDLSDTNVLNAFRTFQFIQVGFGFFLVPSLVFSKLMSWPEENFLRTNTKPATGLFLITAVIAVVSIPFINYLVYVNSLFTPADWVPTAEQLEEADILSTASGIPSLLFILFAFALVPAVSEEFFFRAVLMRMFFRSSRSMSYSIVFSALIFSFMHFQPHYFIPMMLMGILLGYVFYRTGNIWYSVSLHFLNNALAVIFTFLSASGRADKNILSVGSGEDEVIIRTVSMILSGALIFFLYKKTKGREMKNLY